jgi:hypothetical protein
MSEKKRQKKDGRDKNKMNQAERRGTDTRDPAPPRPDQAQEVAREAEADERLRSRS